MSFRLSALLVLLLCSAGTCFAQPDPGSRQVMVPTAWVEDLRRFGPGQDAGMLLRQLDSLIAPDTLQGPKDTPYSDLALLHPLFLNLDDDPAEELVGLFGWSKEDPALAVFKQVDSSWFLVWYEPFYMFYTDPELQVAPTPGSPKTFYIRCLYDRGTGVYQDGWQFYKLIGGRVYPCLQLVNKAYIYGWGLYLNQKVEMKFRFSTKSDALDVTYDYRFFPGPVYDGEVSRSGHRELSFARGRETLLYRWDSLSHTYRPAFSRQPGHLNAAKIAAFGDFGNDSLFVRAYGYELRQAREKGTAAQKKVLAGYLKLVREKERAVAPAGVPEEKAQIGDLKFYGPKEKEQ